MNLFNYGAKLLVELLYQGRVLGVKVLERPLEIKNPDLTNEEIREILDEEYAGYEGKRELYRVAEIAPFHLKPDYHFYQDITTATTSFLGDTLLTATYQLIADNDESVQREL